MKRLLAIVAAAVALAGVGASVQPAYEPGLLFYLSGDRALVADFAEGASEPNFASKARSSGLIWY